ncbi:unnamed protein product [Wuchereria bancrofti]|uniref:Uncharacterized protein n=1 Tax=Wuchereria bancrofti TaxID=6293 RepID=A0A3P7FLG2_WUCBA|nr:unnamed protein product [Wuchereria bancrofti]
MEFSCFKPRLKKWPSLKTASLIENRIGKEFAAHSEMNVTGFSHQVGGHFGIFTCGGHICKPLNSKELAFYKEIGDRFAPFTAHCCGTVSIQPRNSRDDGLILTTDRPVLCHQNATSSEKQLIFRLNKNGRVESDQHFNEWAKQCQTRSVQKLLKVSFEECLS